MAKITTDILMKNFLGVSEFRFAKKSAALVTDQVWDYKVPVTRDSISFTQDTPTANNGYIHGRTAPAWTTSEPGDITLEFNVPSIDEETTGWLTTPTTISTKMKESDTTQWKLRGLKLEGKPVEGMAMMISEDRKYCLIIKNFKGYSSINMDDISTTPMSFTVSGTLQGGVSDDPDGDVVFGELEDIAAGI